MLAIITQNYYIPYVSKTWLVCFARVADWLHFQISSRCCHFCVPVANEASSTVKKRRVWVAKGFGGIFFAHSRVRIAVHSQVFRIMAGNDGQYWLRVNMNEPHPVPPTAPMIQNASENHLILCSESHISCMQQLKRSWGQGFENGVCFRKRSHH